jgi:hypothetical protein
MYKSGTVTVQVILTQFQRDFYGVKERVQQETLSLCDDSPILSHSDHTSSNCPADEDSHPPPSTEHTQVTQLHCFSVIERDTFTELERASPHNPDRTNPQNTPPQHCSRTYAQAVNRATGQTPLLHPPKTILQTKRYVPYAQHALLTPTVMIQA